MTQIAAPVPASLQLAPVVEEATPAGLLGSSPAHAVRRSRWRRLASALSDTHRAAVPF